MRIVKSAEVLSGLLPGAAQQLLARESTSTSLAVWRVGAREQTEGHRHDETEALVILSGAGLLRVEGQLQPVATGEIAIIEPFEFHSIRNESAGDLLYLSVYWRDGGTAVERVRPATLTAQPALSDPVFVTSTPPTPNGDLHLGHLSGPYLGADVHTRFLRMNGRRAFHVTGSDDYQSYVVGKARQRQQSPLETAADYAEQIKLTLAALDIRVDYFYEPRTDQQYRALQARLLQDLLDRGSVYAAHEPAAFDTETGEYAYEVDIKGTCPVCHSASGGNICEECGQPNRCVDMVGCTSLRSNSPPRTQPAKRLHFRLSRYLDAVGRHHRTARLAPRLRELLGQLQQRPVVDPAVTHPGTWGIPIDSLAGCEGQTIWAWFEMAGGLLYAISRVDPHAEEPTMLLPKRGRIVHFFGFDNSYYHTVLFPAIYAAAFGAGDLPIDYCYNEFLLLDQQKFSTSRNHAIWGREILTTASSDAVRFALAHERPESVRTDFTRPGFLSLVRGTLIDQWQSWLQRLHGEIRTHSQGQAPDAGIWTQAHMEFLGRLSEYPARLARNYGASAFSLRAAARDLCSLVQDVREFALSESHWSSAADCQSHRRTALALQLAAARLLAQLAAPLMPRFSESLWSGLGQPGTLESSGWPTRAVLCQPGALVQLDAEYFRLS
jgi:methionyl-tRNA synthetase